MCDKLKPNLETLEKVLRRNLTLRPPVAALFNTFNRRNTHQKVKLSMNKKTKLT